MNRNEHRFSHNIAGLAICVAFNIILAGLGIPMHSSGMLEAATAFSIAAGGFLLASIYYAYRIVKGETK